MKMSKQFCNVFTLFFSLSKGTPRNKRTKQTPGLVKSIANSIIVQTIQETPEFENKALLSVFNKRIQTGDQSTPIHEQVEIIPDSAGEQLNAQTPVKVSSFGRVIKKKSPGLAELEMESKSLTRPKRNTRKKIVEEIVTIPSTVEETEPQQVPKKRSKRIATITEKVPDIPAQNIVEKPVGRGKRARKAEAPERKEEQSEIIIVDDIPELISEIKETVDTVQAINANTEKSKRGKRKLIDEKSTENIEVETKPKRARAKKVIETIEPVAQPIVEEPPMAVENPSVETVNNALKNPKRSQHKDIECGIVRSGLTITKVKVNKQPPTSVPEMNSNIQPILTITPMDHPSLSGHKKIAEKSNVDTVDIIPIVEVAKSTRGKRKASENKDVIDLTEMDVTEKPKRGGRKKVIQEKAQASENDAQQNGTAPVEIIDKQPTTKSNRGKRKQVLEVEKPAVSPVKSLVSPSKIPATPTNIPSTGASVASTSVAMAEIAVPSTSDVKPKRTYRKKIKLDDNLVVEPKEQILNLEIEILDPATAPKPKVTRKRTVKPKIEKAPVAEIPKNDEQAAQPVEVEMKVAPIKLLKVKRKMDDVNEAVEDTAQEAPKRARRAKKVEFQIEHEAAAATTAKDSAPKDAAEEIKVIITPPVSTRTRRKARN